MGAISRHCGWVAQKKKKETLKFFNLTYFSDSPEPLHTGGPGHPEQSGNMGGTDSTRGGCIWHRRTGFGGNSSGFRHGMTLGGGSARGREQRRPVLHIAIPAGGRAQTGVGHRGSHPGGGAHAAAAEAPVREPAQAGLPPAKTGGEGDSNCAEGGGSPKYLISRHFSNHWQLKPRPTSVIFPQGNPALPLPRGVGLDGDQPRLPHMPRGTARKARSISLRLDLWGSPRKHQL